MMEKSEFLKEISSLSREELDLKLNEKVKRTKKIWPAVYINRSKKEKEKKI